jgi:hypothetical protein
VGSHGFFEKDSWSNWSGSITLMLSVGSGWSVRLGMRLLQIVSHELMESAFTGVVLGQFFGLLGQVLWSDAWRSHDKLVNGTIQLLLLGPCWGSTFTTAHVLDICLTTFKVKVGSVDITFILDLSALLAVELESFSSSSLKQRFTSRSKST